MPQLGIGQNPHLPEYRSIIKYFHCGIEGMVMTFIKLGLWQNRIASYS